MRFTLWAIAMALGLLGCTFLPETSAQGSTENKGEIQKVPAVLSLSQNNDELQQLITQLSGNHQVMLADSAFTKDSNLTIERKAHTALNGQLINGRVLERPMLFHLFIKAGQCFIENTSSGEQALVKQTECQIK